MPGQIARADLHVPVVTQLHREIGSTGCALILADLEDALLTIVIAREIISHLVGATADARAVGATMSVYERTVCHQRVEDQQRVGIWRAQSARLAVECAGSTRTIGVPLVGDAQIVRRIIGDVSN